LGEDALFPDVLGFVAEPDWVCEPYEFCELPDDGLLAALVLLVLLVPFVLLVVPFVLVYEFSESFFVLLVPLESFVLLVPLESFVLLVPLESFVLLVPLESFVLLVPGVVGSYVGWDVSSITHTPEQQSSS
jgi:hypothetical protein